jgi:hypothetical protein
MRGPLRQVGVNDSRSLLDLTDSQMADIVRTLGMIDKINGSNAYYLFS